MQAENAWFRHARPILVLKKDQKGPNRTLLSWLCAKKLKKGTFLSFLEQSQDSKALFGPFWPFLRGKLGILGVLGGTSGKIGRIWGLRPKMGHFFADFDQKSDWKGAFLVTEESVKTDPCVKMGILGTSRFWIFRYLFMFIRSIEKMKIFPKILRFGNLRDAIIFNFWGKKYPKMGIFAPKRAKMTHLGAYGRSFQGLGSLFSLLWKVTRTWASGELTKGVWRGPEPFFTFSWKFSLFKKVNFFTFCDFLIAERNSLGAPSRDRKPHTGRAWTPRDRPVCGFIRDILVHVDTCSFWGQISFLVGLSSN